MNNVIQVVSVIGALLILSAFLLLQQRRWTSEGKLYLWVNLIGSVLLAIVAIWDRRAGFVLLEGAWALVSAWSLLRSRHPTAGSLG